MGGADTWPYAWPGVVALDWRPRAMAGYAAWMLLLTVAYAAFPGARTLAWSLIGISGVAAIVAGMAWHHPARSEPWLLLAGACASLAASQAGSASTRVPSFPHEPFLSRVMARPAVPAPRESPRCHAFSRLIRG